jgi:RNA polymerase sigma factor (sigma-70 family)
MSRLVDHVRRAALRQAGGGLSDGQLLGCFLDQRDEAAFAALVRRHGPMVLGVCRRLLGNLHDAEDAFQATFLVLIRKAPSIQPRELVGHWLYGVAYRTALAARGRITRRRMEQPVQDMPHPPNESDPARHDLLPLLDQELARLPDKYRVPVVLCELEGQSRKHVAALLQIPEGTLSSRLAYARKRLARRLSRPGLLLSAGVLARLLGHNVARALVPPPLVLSTTRAALGQTVAAAPVLTLTQGVLKSMFLTRIKALGALALAVLLGAGIVRLTYQEVAAQSKQPVNPTDAQQARDSTPAARANDRVADELDALRLEIEALRKGLQATRARVKVLEDEVRTLRATHPARQPFHRRAQGEDLQSSDKDLPLQPEHNRKARQPADNPSGD